MNDFLSFSYLFGFVLCQRMVELLIAKKNETWMKRQGAIEFGTIHYRFMVLIHMLFLICFVLEVLVFKHGLSPIWPVLLTGFVLTQVLRIWVIGSLGRYWNTKIIVLPNAAVVRKGPYRYIKHPNYLVVSIEIVVIPLLYNAYYTALLFTVLNLIMLAVRIPKEEQALGSVTEYNGAFQDCPRLIPKIVK
jgi:methyltransferase